MLNIFLYLLHYLHLRNIYQCNIMQNGKIWQIRKSQVKWRMYWSHISHRILKNYRLNGWRKKCKSIKIISLYLSLSINVRCDSTDILTNWRVLYVLSRLSGDPLGNIEKFQEQLSCVRCFILFIQGRRKRIPVQS